MKKRTEIARVKLSYLGGLDEPEKGVFRSAVADPKYTNELLLWVERLDEWVSEKTEVHLPSRCQVNLCGSRRSLYELGCYLVALSRFDTADAGYHDHFDELGAPRGKSPCELLVHGPGRLLKKGGRSPTARARPRRERRRRG
jgi:hypothetical protein